MPGKLAVIIPTLNEEKNLPYALESCAFADQVFVLDSGSNDRSRQIAEDYGATFVFHPWEGYARQKNWGLDHLPIESDWVFFLDADESITDCLREELREIVSGARTTDLAGFYVNRYFVWEGKRIRHCGYYPSWNLRFFRRGMARYELRDVHEHMVVSGPVGYLDGEMHHEDRRGRDYLWQKHLGYAALEARELVKILHGSSSASLRASFLGNSLERRRAFKEWIWPHLPVRWLFRFVYMYVLRLGFLDGGNGLDMCIFMLNYEREIARKYKELKGLA